MAPTDAEKGSRVQKEDGKPPQLPIREAVDVKLPAYCRKTELLMATSHLKLRTISSWCVHSFCSCLRLSCRYESAQVKANVCYFLHRRHLATYLLAETMSSKRLAILETVNNIVGISYRDCSNVV